MSNAFSRLTPPQSDWCIMRNIVCPCERQNANALSTSAAEHPPQSVVARICHGTPLSSTRVPWTFHWRNPNATDAASSAPLHSTFARHS